MTSDDLFTREEALGGFPARQASMLLYLIEMRVSHLIRQSRQVTERFLTEDVEREQELAFYEAFTLGRDPDPKPTIQDLERFAAEWWQLVPDDPGARAALAHALGRKYTFTYGAIPGIRSELGLDGPDVWAAYEKLYGEPMGAVYSAAPGLVGRVRWLWCAFSGWLESLPPFWSVYALTLTETVGAGILALPIAVAGIGPLAGVAVLVVLGLVNVLTIAFMAEAAIRSGTIRYGNTYVGRMVDDFLGGMGSVVLSVATFSICALALLAYYIGFSTTMSAIIPLPAEIWAMVLFAVGLYFISRKSLNMTIASALMVGAINICLILILSIIGFTRLQPENLAYFNVPFLGGAPFDPSILGLIFGVIVSAYFGHLSVSTVSKSVMRRDPTGRSLLGGAAAAQLTIIALYCIWVLAANGAIAPGRLASETGTALVPLAERAGPIVSIFGSIFVILGMGMGSIHFSLGLFNLTRERLPIRSRPALAMPRGRARLLFRRFGRRGPRVVMTYLGLDEDTPFFEFLFYVDGEVHRIEEHIEGQWQVDDLPEPVRGLVSGGIALKFEVLEATQKSVRVQVDSPMRMSCQGDWDIEGLTIANVFDLPESRRRMIMWMMRQDDPVSVAAVAEHLAQDEEAAGVTLGKLEEQGFIRKIQGDNEVLYEADVGYRRPSVSAQQLFGQGEQAINAPRSPRPSISHILFGDRGRFLMAVVPLLCVFLLAEWSVITGSQSFSGVVSLIGVLVVSLLGGIFPVFLLISARRKGEFVPKRVHRLLGSPVILAFIYLLSLSGIFLHGLVIWEGWAARGMALVVGGLVVAMTIIMAFRGAFSPRAVVEFREEQKEGGLSHLSVVAGGHPARAEVQLQYGGEERTLAAEGLREIPALASLRSAVVRLIGARARELKVWLHRITQDDSSEGLSAGIEVLVDGAIHEMAPDPEGGQAILPLAGELDRITITLAD